MSSTAERSRAFTCVRSRLRRVRGRSCGFTQDTRGSHVRAFGSRCAGKKGRAVERRLRKILAHHVSCGNHLRRRGDVGDGERLERLHVFEQRLELRAEAHDFVFSERESREARDMTHVDVAG